jgi:DNA-binding LacI/PurR family transcriptional regulator
MPVTIKDIASYAKVSTATVSLALQGKTVIAEATRGRIQRLAAELGYTPSGIGRALQSGRSGLIGYLLSSVASSYFNEVLQGVGVEAARRGYGLLTAITDGSELNVARQLKVFREKRVDGLLVSSRTPRPCRRLLISRRRAFPSPFVRSSRLCTGFRSVLRTTFSEGSSPGGILSPGGRNE